MGYRIHVAEVYEVRHSNSAHFSNNSVDINRLLYENCPDMNWEGEDIESSERLEVPRSELAALIGKIASDREGFAEWLKLHHIEESVDDCISIIAGWIAKSDPRNDFVVLSWY